MEPGEQEMLKELVLKQYYYYGDQRYDYKGVVMVPAQEARSQGGMVGARQQQVLV